MEDAGRAGEPDPSPEGGRPSAVRRWRARGEATADRAKGWLEDRRQQALPVDLAVQFYERDRDSFASVLGAAIALRLFLFFVPAMLVLLSLVMLFSGHDGVRNLAENAGVTGGMAAQVEQAASTSRTTSFGLFVAGAWLLLWAGRSLTKTLASCSAGSWRMLGRESKATLRMAAAVTTLVMLLVVTAAIMNRVRQTQGLAVVTTSWLVAGALYSLGWFLVCATLPRRTTDPGALLPGAVLTGTAFAALQWFVQFYLPAKLENVTAVAGGIGTAVVTLGYMFFIGRVMASSFILDAVIFERIGSVSGLVFSLPGLRRLPRRSPRLARYFDLAHEAGAVGRGDADVTADADPVAPDAADGAGPLPPPQPGAGAA
jgi:uncharacterized BrkB/YihY/UPF0761 family membrane protein